MGLSPSWTGSDPGWSSLVIPARGILWCADRGLPHRTLSTFLSLLALGLSRPHLALATWAFLTLLTILQNLERSEL